MTPSDFHEFSNLSVNAHAVSSSNQRSSDPAISMAFDVLSEFPIDVVRQALLMHARRSRFGFAPTPADVFKVLDAARPQHLSADEAWALAIRLSDEGDTVIYTQEIMDAWVTARPVLELVDEVGARMAFRSAYDSLPKSLQPVWLVSRGHDKHMRLSRIQEAVELGRLPASKLDSIRIDQHGDMKALEDQVESRLRLEGSSSDLEKIKAGIAGLRGTLDGGYIAETSDARVAARRVLIEQQRERELGGVL